MGCVVNGPGESRDADVGLSGGRGKGVIYRKGVYARTVPEDQFLDEVLKEVASILPEHEAKLVYPGDERAWPGQRWPHPQDWHPRPDRATQAREGAADAWRYP